MNKKSYPFQKQETLMEFTIAAAVSAVLVTTVLYKILPHRSLGAKQPIIAFLPKYKHVLEHAISKEKLERELTGYGFRKTKEQGNRTMFVRGSLLGDFSINLAKVKAGLIERSTNRYELTVEAAWVAAFDTGDHWKFLKELCNKLTEM
jgi:hypothetical protein